MNADLWTGTTAEYKIVPAAVVYASSRSKTLENAVVQRLLRLADTLPPDAPMGMTPYEIWAVEAAMGCRIDSFDGCPLFLGHRVVEIPESWAA